MQIHKTNAAEFLDRLNRPGYEDLQRYLMMLPAVGVNVWLAGGALRRTIINDDHSKGDFDYFFHSKEDYEKFHATIIKNYGGKVVRDESHVTEFHVPNLDDISNPLKVQAIKMQWYANPEELIKDFDYTCCMLSYDGVHVYYGQYTLWDNARKRLAVNKIKYPVASLRRLIKYSNQGYYACNGTLHELAGTIHEMPPKDFKESAITYVD